jgi:hypothetical protein
MGSTTARHVLLVGWSLLAVTDDRLHSWLGGHVWGSDPTPPPAPDEDRRCGRWALFDLGRCVDEARRGHSGRHSFPVLGLTEGRGAIVLHGDEGFRAEHGSVLCLFDDSVWDGRLDPVARARRRPPWRHRLGIAKSADERAAALRSAASTRGIPVMSLSEAIRYGTLAEFGLPLPRGLP